MTPTECGATYLFMNAAQTAALRAFLSTLTAAQRAAMMDVMSSHVEGVEVSLEAETCDEPMEFDFVVAVKDATVAAVVG